MPISLTLLTLCQGLLFINNVAFIAINGLVGLSLAQHSWMATLPVVGYVVGGALSTGLVAKSQSLWGRKISFQLGLLVAFASALLAAYATWTHNFWLLIVATVVAGYYSANGQLYRFAAAELATDTYREKAISWVLTGGLLGAVFGPTLATGTKNILPTPFVGTYLALGLVALLGVAFMQFIKFPSIPKKTTITPQGRSLGEIIRQPIFIVAAATGAISYGVMNLLMAATPLAMQGHGHSFTDAAFVLEWHVIAMFAPGFFTGTLIRRYGAHTIMLVGVLLNFGCIAVALSGIQFQDYLIALFLLGLGWNFLFTGSTTLSMQAWTSEEKDKGQAAINFFIFTAMAITSFASGVLVTTGGWDWLNYGSIAPVAIAGIALFWLKSKQRHSSKK